jgi:hypothetical protein
MYPSKLHTVTPSHGLRKQTGRLAKTKTVSVRPMYTTFSPGRDSHNSKEHFDRIQLPEALKLEPARDKQE